VIEVAHGYWWIRSTPVDRDRGQRRIVAHLKPRAASFLILRAFGTDSWRGAGGPGMAGRNKLGGFIERQPVAAAATRKCFRGCQKQKEGQPDFRAGVAAPVDGRSGRSKARSRARAYITCYVQQLSGAAKPEAWRQDRRDQSSPLRCQARVARVHLR
jgi:hypothetical protein